MFILIMSLFLVLNIFFSRYLSKKLLNKYSSLERFNPAILNILLYLISAFLFFLLIYTLLILLFLPFMH